ncbi:hypothetical protein ABZ769_35585 [Streptomyces olivoreticuli]
MPIRNRSSWLATAILAQDCPDPACEDGTLLTTGTVCSECAEQQGQRLAAYSAITAAANRLEAESATIHQRTSKAAAEAFTLAAAAAREEEQTRQRLVSAGLWGGMLDYKVSRHMAAWAKERTSSSGLETQ